MEPTMEPRTERARTDAPQPAGGGTAATNELEELRAQNQRLWDDAIADADRIDTLSRTMAEQAERLKELEDRDQGNTRRIEDLERDLHEARRQAGRQGQIAAQLEQTLFRIGKGGGARNAPADEPQKLHEELSRRASALKRAEDANAALETQLRKANAALDEARRTTDALRTEQEQAKQAHATRLRELDAERLRLEQENAQGTAALEALNAELHALQASSVPRTQAQEELAAARKAVLETEARHQAALRALERRLAMVQAELDTATRALAQAEQTPNPDQVFQAGFDKAIRMVTAHLEHLSGSGSLPSTAVAPPYAMGPDRAKVAAALADRMQALEAVKERLRTHHEDTEQEQNELNARLRSLKASRPRKGTPEAEEVMTIESRLEALRQEPISFQREARRIEDACERLRLRLDAFDELASDLPAALLTAYGSASGTGESTAPASEGARPHPISPSASASVEPVPLSQEERRQLLTRHSERYRVHVGAFLFMALLELIPEQTGPVTAVFAAAKRAGLEHPEDDDIPAIQTRVTSPPLTTWLHRRARSGRNDWTIGRNTATSPWHDLGRPLYGHADRDRFLAEYAKLR